VAHGRPESGEPDVVHVVTSAVTGTGQAAQQRDLLTPRYQISLLLVDDQPIVGEAIRRALADQPDIDFHYCSKGSDAIGIIERVKPSVILQDLVMPGTDGLTLLRAYRANPATRDVPVIVLSTKEEPAVKSESFALGADDYLVKLPDNIELIARIRHHAKSYLNQMQRDEAYRALRESQQLLLEKNLELERLTNIDGLTGLSNRRYFDEYAGIQWKQSIREKQPICFLMIDVDNFKRYNDNYGHLAGDEVLKKVAAAIRGCCRRPTDLVARFGGEEFVASLCAPPDGTRHVAEKICRAVEALAIPHGHSTVAHVVTISVGGAWTVPASAETPNSLLDAADVALYQAKHGGKNRVVFRS
jgi:two-component system chemotaxis family response regulator WspR